MIAYASQSGELVKMAIRPFDPFRPAAQAAHFIGCLKSAILYSGFGAELPKQELTRTIVAHFGDR